jgi:hypothetical protein
MKSVKNLYGGLDAWPQSQGYAELVCENTEAPDKSLM